MKRNNQLLLPAWYYLLGLILLGIVFFPATHHFFVHTGRRWLYILVLAFSFSALTTPLCQMLAMRWGLVDNPSGHKIHKDPTPFLGGAAVFLDFVCHSLSMASSAGSLEPSCSPPSSCLPWDC